MEHDNREMAQYSLIHYHGTPITPMRKLYELPGKNFCVSYATPQDLKRCHEIGQSVMLDNGAFTFWRKGVKVDNMWWSSYAEWAEPWLNYLTTWCVIPDVIDGSEEDNDYLIKNWPQHLFKQSAPVWHMHESLDRLKQLVSEWDKVCIGSSGEYADLRASNWSYRMDEIFDSLCPTTSKPPTWIHMLRAMDKASKGQWPFSSTDSTNVAQNHHRHSSPTVIADRCDKLQPPAMWTPKLST